VRQEKDGLEAKPPGKGTAADCAEDRRGDLRREDRAVLCVGETMHLLPQSLLARKL
jgi:hypothetical protein